MTFVPDTRANFLVDVTDPFHEGENVIFRERPFEQVYPPDETHINLATAADDSVMTFRWQSVRPPDPFREYTDIRFTTVERGQVSLTVHDMLGHRVATLVDGDIHPGTRSLHFRAGDLPAGIYICRLQCGSNARVRTMLLPVRVSPCIARA